MFPAYPLCTAKVIEHSTSKDGVELCTYQLRYPRIIHSEFMTHRVFSRNASSSRAIPVAKMLEQVKNEPAMPAAWGKNQPGMQARELLTGDDLHEVQGFWWLAATSAASIAEGMMEAGAHKQVANRILEPFQFISVVVTATEWDNWNELRDHEDADPTIQLLAKVTKEARAASTPVMRTDDPALTTSWHLPYVTMPERTLAPTEPRTLAKLSTARCARVSYLTHDGKEPNPYKDVDLFDKLVGSRPKHASPSEHQGYPIDRSIWSNNFRGWRQHRQLLDWNT